MPVDYSRPTAFVNKLCSDSTRNEQVETSVCRIHLAVLNGIDVV